MTGPDPAVASTRTAVAAAVGDLAGGSLVLVACSGGADSLALAAATAFLAARAGRRGGAPGLRAGAVVVDHGWHPDSAAVADRAASRCRRLGLDPVEVITVDTAGRDGGPEAAARRARYDALEGAARRLGAAAVLLGHTADDQAETVLLGLARGSGARSLAGMASRRTSAGLRRTPAEAGVEFRRPLLALRRGTTERACRASGLDPWRDPANDDPAYARPRVRAAMRTLEEALGPGIVEALVRTGEMAREDAEALESLAAELADAARTPGPADSYDVRRLAGAPDAVRRRALLLALRRAGAPAGSVGRSHVLAVDALVTGWRGQRPVDLPGGVVAARVCGRLALDRRVPGPA